MLSAIATCAAWGELALAEGRVQDAINEFRQGEGVGQCTLCGLEALGRAYAIAGETDSAIAVYQRHLGILWMQRVTLDAIELPGVYRALGELYEQRGQFQKARSSYTRFIELWKECDSDLRSQVTEIRRRLAQLPKEDAG